MVNLHVMRFDDALGRQFVQLVNRLLPAGSRFRLDPLPRLEYVDVTPSIAFPTGATHVRHVAGVARLDVNPAAPGSNAAAGVWRRRFRDELQRIVSTGAAEIELVASDQSTMVGDWRLRRLDISDIARMPDMMAASALIHELEEQTHRGTHPWEAPDFESPHRQAMAVENRISGSSRVEALELRHPQGVSETSAGPTQRWIWWIPFRSRDGGLWVNKMDMLGRNVIAARLGRYQDETSYRHAFSAEIASRRAASMHTAAS